MLLTHILIVFTLILVHDIKADTRRGRNIKLLWYNFVYIWLPHLLISGVCQSPGQPKIAKSGFASDQIWSNSIIYSSFKHHASCKRLLVTSKQKLSTYDDENKVKFKLEKLNNYFYHLWAEMDFSKSIDDRQDWVTKWREIFSIQIQWLGTTLNTIILPPINSQQVKGDADKISLQCIIPTQ